jgi:hypothetical protein
MALIRDWNEFWFAHKSPGSLGLFRILFGLVCIFWGFLMAPPNLYIWYSQEGMVPLSFYYLYKHAAIQISLLDGVTSDYFLFAFWCVYLFVAILFTIGLSSRISALVLFLMFSSFNVRDALILNSGDTMMRCVLFLLLLAPIGASCSVDRLIAIGKGRDPGGDPAPLELWTQRLIQIQICLVYASSLCSKLSGPDWVNGTAVYFPMHMIEMIRFPLPHLLSSPLMVNVLTWGTLAIEGSLATLLWVRKARPYVLCAGVLLHSGIEYALNIPLFSMIMITSYINFIYNDWLTVFVAALSKSFRRYRLTVKLPAGASGTDRWWLVIERLDALHLLELQQGTEDTDAQLHVWGKGWESVGPVAMRRILISAPAFWLIAPLFFVPGALHMLSPVLPRSRFAPSILEAAAETANVS